MCIHVTSQVVEAITRASQSAFPEECCGLLLGTDGRVTQAVPTRNVHSSPQTHFEIDPQALIDAHRAERAGGLELLGYYHSHPKGPPRPSVIDQAMAAGDGKIWAICGQAEVRFWRDVSRGFQALSYRVLEP